MTDSSLENKRPDEVNEEAQALKEDDLNDATGGKQYIFGLEVVDVARRNVRP